MGRGATKQEIYRHTYNQLRRIARDLDAAGITSTYKQGRLTGIINAGAVVPDAFQVFYTWGTMSNGETWGEPRVVVRDDRGTREVFRGFDFARGIERLKELSKLGYWVQY